MLNLEYLWAWSDSLVYKKWKTDRILKFYTINDKIPEKLSVQKIQLYHSLQNLFANQKFVLDFDSNDDKLWILTQIVKTITFEILYLDDTRIWFASSLNWKKNEYWLVLSEVDYVAWQTLEDKWNLLLWQDTSRNVSQLLTASVANIYYWTQIWDILWYYQAKGIYINPSNFKCRFYWDNLHLIITDTMNCIGLLKI